MQIACFQGNFRRFVGIETMESASPGIPSAMEIFTWFRLKKCHSMSSIDINRQMEQMEAEKHFSTL